MSVVDALVASLQTKVLDGELPPGSGLTENDVAAQFDVSRPTAKSALTHLVAQGLLRREAHKTARVPALSRTDVEDLFLVRIPLELGVIRVLSARGALPQGAARAVADLAGILPGASHSEFVEADLAFHRALVAAVDSPRLTRLYAALSGEIHLSMVQSRDALGRDRIADEHRAIYEALRAADAELAEGLMRTHLEGACAALAAKLDRPAEHSAAS